MFLTSQDKRTMNNRSSSDSERQHLLDRLLDAVKQCQVRFGGKTELATDSDSRVTCLLAQLLAIFGHGLRKPKGTVRAFMQVGQVAGITKQGELEPDFYGFVKEHLSKNEKERFLSLHKITTDAGRGRAWLRSTINEHTLEKSIHTMLGDKQLLSLYYTPEAFLLDEERSSMLPMIAAGLSSILFALGIDKEELNAVRQVSSQLPSTKEVFSNLLSSFPTSKSKPEPAPFVAESIQREEKAKKKKKKKSAAIVSIGDGDSSSTDDLSTYRQGRHDFPLSDTSVVHSKPSKKTTKQGHSRSSSYPGKIHLEIPDNKSGTSLPRKSYLSEHALKGISIEISLSDDSLTESSKGDITWTDNSRDYDYCNKGTSVGQAVQSIEGKDERHTKDEKDSPHGIHGNITNIKSASNRELNDSSSSSDYRDKNMEEPVVAPDTDYTGKQDDIFSIRSFKTQNTNTYIDTTYSAERRTDFEESSSEMNINMSSGSADNTLLAIGGDYGLTPLVGNLNRNDKPDKECQGYQDGGEDRDSVSLSSNSWIDDTDDKLEQSEDDLKRARSESLTAATDAAAAALEFCTPTPNNHMTRFTTNNGNTLTEQPFSSRQETMSTSELKQALVSMMLRKDEFEDQNRVLQKLVEEKRHEKSVMEAEMEQIEQDRKTRQHQDAAQISVLTRENEVLKHQLKKYVGAVQMLKSNMTSTTSNNTQDEDLNPLPEPDIKHSIDSETEAHEYQQKLIQVAEMHGELFEFNERLQRQLNHWQAYSKRLQEELITLRGPLPEDCSATLDPSGVANTLALLSANNRPLINIWIPSVFLKEKGSAGVHHLYQVYIRIKDDEWNVYRRYSQFHELHKQLYRKHKIAERFKFPSKKTFGNRGTRFVEERRRALQEYIRHAINLILSTEAEFKSDACRETLLNIIPFFGDPFPRGNTKRQTNVSQPYDGL